jgi:hypothetical protein
MSVSAKMSRLLSEVQHLNEADEIDIVDLPAKLRKAIEGLASHGFKASIAFKGIHGTVVVLNASVGVKGLSVRLDADQLKAIMDVPGFRWLETDKGSLNVGC